MGKRIKRDGEWGGEGYTSLPGSAAGSVSHDIQVEVEREEYVGDEEEMVLPLPKDSPPVPPKPVYLGWRPNRIDKGEKDMGVSSCHTRQMVLPPSCIPIGFDGPAELSPTRNHQQRLGRKQSRPLPRRPAPYNPENEDKEAVRYRQGDIQVAGRQGNRRSKVMSYVSTGQISWKSKRRWMIWLGVGCIVGLTATAGVLVGVLAGRG